MKAENKNAVKMLIFLFAATYMVSYITRINYGAIISEMQTATGFSKSLLSMSLTGSFITYGAGQIISGVCGDKISPKKLVLYGLCATVLINFLLPFCQNPYQMLAVWSVNGFAQSFMWPPIVKIMAAVLSEDDYKNAVTKVSWGSSIGTIVVYLIAPVLISVFSWRAVFIFSAAMGLIMIFIWNRFAEDVKIKAEGKASSEKRNTLFTPVMIFIMIAIILQGMLRDGVTTWMPSYISETYNLSNEISILTGVILPVFSILSFNVASKIYMSKLKNPLVCSAVFFGAGTLSAVLLGMVSGQNAIFSVLMFALVTGCMHGVNLMLICMIPPYFQSTGKVSTVSGVLNSCTYIGSAISTYGIALLSETFGWSFTILIWIIISAAGTAICSICGNNRTKQTKAL